MRETVKDWVTEAGYRALVLLVHGNHYCGYVGIPKDHPLYGVSYSDDCESLAPAYERALNRPIDKKGIIPVVLGAMSGRRSMDICFNVHGSVTYTGSGLVEGTQHWWVGFDCAHYDDLTLDEEFNELGRVFMEGEEWKGDYRKLRDIPFVVNECENLANELLRVEQECSRADR